MVIGSTGHKNQKPKETRKPFLYASLCISKDFFPQCNFWLITMEDSQVVKECCSTYLWPWVVKENSALFHAVETILYDPWLQCDYFGYKNNFASCISKALTELDMPEDCSAVS